MNCSGCLSPLALSFGFWLGSVEAARADDTFASVAATQSESENFGTGLNRQVELAASLSGSCAGLCCCCYWLCFLGDEIVASACSKTDLANGKTTACCSQGRRYFWHLSVLRPE